MRPRLSPSPRAFMRSAVSRARPWTRDAHPCDGPVPGSCWLQQGSPGEHDPPSLTRHTVGEVHVAAEIERTASVAPERTIEAAVPTQHGESEVVVGIRVMRIGALRGPTEEDPPAAPLRHS